MLYLWSLLFSSCLVCWPWVCPAQSTKSKDYRSAYLQAVEKFSNGAPVLQADPISQKAHYQAFVDFSLMTEKINKKSKKTWRAGINFLSILTPAERHRLYGLNASEIPEADIAHNTQHFPPLLQGKLRASTVDHRAQLPSVKNQGSCGSCWSFGATAALEYQVARLSGEVKAFSEQEYLNCVYEGQERDGCEGGWPANCFKYNARAGRMALMGDFPYRSHDSKCSMGGVSNGLAGYKVDTTVRYVKGDSDVLQAVANSNIGVLTAGIHVTEEWGAYQTGVWASNSDCDMAANHAVVVTGYGSHHGQPYWLVRNSWGTGWGEEGYIRMSRVTENLCRLTQYTHYPSVTQEKRDNPDNNKEEEEEEEEARIVCRWTAQKKKDLYRPIGQMKMKPAAAKAACIASDQCVAIACNKRRCGMRGAVVGYSDDKVTSYIMDCEVTPTCRWRVHKKTDLYRPIGEMDKKQAAAKADCIVDEQCVAIACSKRKCGLRGAVLGYTDAKTTSFIMDCE